MKSIYCSKIYLSSKRKDKIKAAAQDPVNLELVTQLADYLDDDIVERNNSSIDTELEVNEDTFDFESDTVDFPDEETGSSSKGSRSSSSHRSSAPLGPKPDLSEHSFSDESGGDRPSNDLPDKPDKPDVPEEPSNSEIEESEEIKSDSEKVTASVDEVLSVLKGSLNSREDTCGVNRAQVKDSELWIYYSDDVNLNNIMTNVIEYLDRTGRSALEFNRLARTDNAMVFQIPDGELPLLESVVL